MPPKTRPAAAPAMSSPARTASEDSQVARVLEDGFARLHFPRPLEQGFRAHHLLTSQYRVRLSILVALSTTLGFAMIDHWVIHSSNPIPDLARFGLQVPTILLCLLATFTPFYVRFYERAIQICAPLFGIGTVLMAGYAEPQHTPLVGARLLLVAFFLYFMLGMRFVQALRCNFIVLAALVVAGTSGTLAAQVAIYLTFALFCANVIGGAGAYALEHANRTAFLERKLLEETAALDGLTRLLNRHTFEARVPQLWHAAVHRQAPVAVLMIDVDDFKRYNDCYGHQAGDECLRLIAGTVRTALGDGPASLLARYGGEELIALMADHSGAEVEMIAERIVAQVRALGIAHSASSAATTVSVSVGAAAHPSPAAISYSALAKLADNALYAAKHQGRNRSTCVRMQARDVAGYSGSGCPQQLMQDAALAAARSSNHP